MTSTSPAPGWYADPAGAANTHRWWDGTTWTDQLRAAQAPAPTGYGAPGYGALPGYGAMPVAPSGGCQFCGGMPTADVVRKRQHGMVYLRRSWSQPMRACRECGLGMVRAWQNETLAAGWWGTISLFTNVGAVSTNATSLKTLGALPAPQGAVRPGPGAGASIWKRPGVYVPVGVVLLLVVVLSTR